MNKAIINFRKGLDQCSITKFGNDCKEENIGVVTSIINNISDMRYRHIFRYIGNELLLKEYNCGIENIPLLSQYIFLYGDKSKLFYDKLNLNQEYYNLSIDEIDKKKFEFIFDKLVKIFVNTDTLSSANTKEKIYLSDDYKNAHFYFSNITKEDWIQRIFKKDKKKRQLIKDYYVSYLHTVGLLGYGRNTYFLSTSTSYNVCKQWQLDNLRNECEGIILVGWTKKNDIKKTFCKQNNNFLEKYGLLTFHSPLFPEQNEITLKCGLLPHFTIGYFYNDKFEINPYLLKIKEEDIPNVIKDGLDIDQSDFNQKITETNFRNFYIYLDNQYFQF